MSRLAFYFRMQILYLASYSLAYPRSLAKLANKVLPKIKHSTVTYFNSNPFPQKNISPLSLESLLRQPWLQQWRSDLLKKTIQQYALKLLFFLALNVIQLTYFVCFIYCFLCCCCVLDVLVMFCCGLLVFFFFFFSFFLPVPQSFIPFSLLYNSVFFFFFFFFLFFTFFLNSFSFFFFIFFMFCSAVDLLVFSLCCVIWMSYIHTLPARDLAPEAHDCRNVLECSWMLGTWHRKHMVVGMFLNVLGYTEVWT